MNSIDFTRGVPSEDSFPVDSFSKALVRGIEKDWKTILQYGSALGYEPLRKLIADWYQCPVEQVMVSNGSLEIIKFLCEAFLDPGDTVFVESPTYDRTLTILRSRGVQIVGIPLQADGPDIDILQERLKHFQPVLFYGIPDFQNPTGITWSLEKRFAVVELAEQYGFAIIEDDPYRLLRYKGEDVQTLSSMSSRVWYLSSFTKLIAAGPRVGYLVANPAIVAKAARFAENSHITPGLLAQGGVYQWCVVGLLDAQVEKLKALYTPRLNACLEGVDEYLPGSEIVRPEGGFFVSIRLPENVTSEGVRLAGQEQGVKVSYGGGFFPEPSDGPNQPHGDHMLRLPFPAISSPLIKEGVKRLADIIHTYR